MRYLASSLVVAWMVVSAVKPLMAASKVTPPALPQAAEALLEAQQAYGVMEETPNQKRIRLGQPIVASFPPPEYGEAIETPNQRRARLASQTASLQ